MDIDWSPQEGPQFSLIKCPVYDVFFGGARGGGKTEAMLGEWIEHALTCRSAARGVFFRRELPQLEDVINRSQELFTRFGTWHEQKKTWRFDNGAILKFRPLERDIDAQKYQGHSYTRIYVEEIVNFPNPAPIDKLYACLRSPHNVPCVFRCTGNPGGPGHSWVKQRYIDPAPLGYKCLDIPGLEDMDLKRMFIPSRVEDNKLLLESQPRYVDQLKLVGSEDLVRAWLEGDWDVTLGAAFEKLSKKRNMIRRFDVPKWWTKIMVIDWGTAAPFAVCWFVVNGEDLILSEKEDWPERLIPKNSIILYREFYGWNGQPNVGCRKESFEVVKDILDIEEARGEKIDFRIGDSAMWSQVDGASVQQRMYDASEGDFYMEQSIKDRESNYQEIRARIAGEEGVPRFYATEDCTHFWRTMPDLQLDELHPEKGYDTKQEDHIADCVAYVCARQPYAHTRIDRAKEAYEHAKSKTSSYGGGYE
jgi:hypothetical protein